VSGSTARQPIHDQRRSPPVRFPILHIAMTDVNDGPFHEGQPVWVIQGDGSQRAAEYVGEGELSAWFGGSPTVIVVFPDDHSGAAVEFDRVIPRHASA
jgi:hypothetical protein